MTPMVGMKHMSTVAVGIDVQDALAGSIEDAAIAAAATA